MIIKLIQKESVERDGWFFGVDSNSINHVHKSDLEKYLNYSIGEKEWIKIESKARKLSDNEMLIINP